LGLGLGLKFNSLLFSSLTHSGNLRFPKPFPQQNLILSLVALQPFSLYEY
jgi:hypothetical protein